MRLSAYVHILRIVFYGTAYVIRILSKRAKEDMPNLRRALGTLGRAVEY